MSILDRENNLTHQDEDNRFEVDSDDVFIINAVGSDDPKPVYVTLDVRQLRRPTERRALRESGMNLVFLKAGMQQVAFNLMVAKMVLTWPEIVKACARTTAPTVFEIGPNLNPKVGRLCLTADL